MSHVVCSKILRPIIKRCNGCVRQNKFKVFHLIHCTDIITWKVNVVFSDYVKRYSLSVLANSNSRLWIKSNAWTESIEDKKVLIKDEITNPIVKFQLRFLYFSFLLCLSILKLTYEYRSWYHFLVQIPFGYWPILALHYILNHTKEMPYKKKLDPV